MFSIMGWIRNVQFETDRIFFQCEKLQIFMSWVFFDNFYVD